MLGSFFTLAIYRIPLRQDITHTRSFCPNCNHKLSFFDLIPVLSFIFLKGKCRYCKQKINNRYIIIEILSGLIYLIFVMSLKFNFLSANIEKGIYLLFATLYFATLFITAGIEQQTKKISGSVIIFGAIVQLFYITYLYILHYNIYRYIIYFAILLICIFLNRKQDKYILDILSLVLIILIFTGELVTILSTALALLIVFIQKMMCKKEKKAIPVTVYISISSFIILILYNFLIL